MKQGQFFTSSICCTMLNLLLFALSFGATLTTPTPTTTTTSATTKDTQTKAFQISTAVLLALLVIVIVVFCLYCCTRKTTGNIGEETRRSQTVTQFVGVGNSVQNPIENPNSSAAPGGNDNSVNVLCNHVLRLADEQTNEVDNDIDAKTPRRNLLLSAMPHVLTLVHGETNEGDEETNEVDIDIGSTPIGRINQSVKTPRRNLLLSAMRHVCRLVCGEINEDDEETNDVDIDIVSTLGGIDQSVKTLSSTMPNVRRLADEVTNKVDIDIVSTLGRFDQSVKTLSSTMSNVRRLADEGTIEVDEETNEVDIGIVSKALGDIGYSVQPPNGNRHSSEASVGRGYSLKTSSGNPNSSAAPDGIDQSVNVFSSHVLRLADEQTNEVDIDIDATTPGGIDPLVNTPRRNLLSLAMSHVRRLADEPTNEVDVDIDASIETE